MSYTEVTNRGCLETIMGSIVGVLVGALLILVAFVVLFFNEGRAVHRARSLAEGKGAVVSVSADKIDPANEGKLVHVTGQVVSKGTLDDPAYDVGVPGALRLRRTVEMFQWKEDHHSETRNKLGGGTETVTTYTYDRVWSKTLIKSVHFHVRAGHENPTTMPDNHTFGASPTLGAFAIDTGLLNQMDTFEPFPLTTLPAGGSMDSFKGRAHIDNGVVYVGSNPAAPVVGDLRISFQAVKPQTFSVVARQLNTTFAPYHARDGGNDLEFLTPGAVDAAQMFKEQEAGNATLTWVLRGVGFVLMLIGLGLLFGPLVAVADVIPLFGAFVGAGVGLFAFAGAAMLSLMTIAVGWMAYRPLFGILLMAAGIGVFVGLRQMAGGRK